MLALLDACAALRSSPTEDEAAESKSPARRLAVAAALGPMRPAINSYQRLEQLIFS